MLPQPSLMFTPLGSVARIAKSAPSRSRASGLARKAAPLAKSIAIFHPRSEKPGGTVAKANATYSSVASGIARTRPIREVEINCLWRNAASIADSRMPSVPKSLFDTRAKLAGRRLKRNTKTRIQNLEGRLPMTKNPQTANPQPYSSLGLLCRHALMTFRQGGPSLQGGGVLVFLNQVPNRRRNNQRHQFSSPIFHDKAR